MTVAATAPCCYWGQYIPAQFCYCRDTWTAVLGGEILQSPYCRPVMDNDNDPRAVPLRQTRTFHSCNCDLGVVADVVVVVVEIVVMSYY